MTYHRLETREGDRFYREVGAGEPIVFLHCSSGSSGAWVSVMNQLVRDHRALAPDLLGYGRSAPWPRDLPLASDGELGVLEALLDVVGQPVHLVGHSYGGTVALNAARRFPRRVASLTLIESPFTCCDVRMSLPAGARSRRWPSATWHLFAKGGMRRPPRPLSPTGRDRRPGNRCPMRLATVPSAQRPRSPPNGCSCLRRKMILMPSLKPRLPRCLSAAGALARRRGRWSRSSAKLYSMPAITRLPTPVI